MPNFLLFDISSQIRIVQVALFCTWWLSNNILLFLNRRNTWIENEVLQAPIWHADSTEVGADSSAEQTEAWEITLGCDLLLNSLQFNNCKNIIILSCYYKICVHTDSDLTLILHQHKLISSDGAAAICLLYTSSNEARIWLYISPLKSAHKGECKISQKMFA